MSIDAKERMLEAQKLYEEIKKDNETIKEFKESFEVISERMNKMQAYYESQWMEDMDALYKKGEEIEVMGEDPIYNEMMDQYDHIREILLKCAEYINR